MFGLTDMIVVGVIEDALKDLGNNPIKLEFILGGLSNLQFIRNKISTNHVKNIIDFIQENRIHVNTAYDLDIDRIPSIIVGSQGSESVQIMGDYAGSNISIDSCQDVLPKQYAEWLSSSYSGDELVVSHDYGLTSKLWRNVFIRNGNYITQLVGMTIGGAYDTLFLKDPIPEGTPLSGWVAQSDFRAFSADLGFSADNVDVTCQIRTSGDVYLNKILSIIVRYALKSFRSQFAYYGINLPTISYSMPQPADGGSEIIWESTVNMSATVNDYWIQRVSELPDRGSGIEVDVTATKNVHYVNDSDIDLIF